jgi:hypothetical protein
MGPFSRRDALRGGRDLAALLSLSTSPASNRRRRAAEAAQDTGTPRRTSTGRSASSLSSPRAGILQSSAAR